MKVIRSDAKLWITIEEDDDGIEILFPNVARIHYGSARYEIIADNLEYILSLTDHYLAQLASNALAAERHTKMGGKPRWLVYNAKTGTSFETYLQNDGSPMVEYKDGKIVWTNPKEGGV